MNVLSVVGARPNFMKLAPVARALDERGSLRHVILHTGQHYDPEMSDSFFLDLAIPAPDINLGVGSGSHAQQTAQVMEKIEPVLLEHRPDVLLVYGDVNSTVAAALVAVKLGIRVGHVEAGLRSWDWTMPEEINRVVTDRLAHLLFTPSRDGDENLLAEGVPRDRVRFVGNVMIDTLVRALPMARDRRAATELGLPEGGFVVVTLHRPSNVDESRSLRALMEALEDLSRSLPVVFPVHPRTKSRLEEFGLMPTATGDLRLAEPVGYLDMLSLVDSAALVLTDSGGLQEETSFLGIPCLTARPNTERPVTISQGTNRLVEPHRDHIIAAADEALAEGRRPDPAIELWDGHAAERIVDVLAEQSG